MLTKSVYKKGSLTLWRRRLACVFTAETAVPQVGTALFGHPLRTHQVPPLSSAAHPGRFLGRVRGEVPGPHPQNPHRASPAALHEISSSV